MEEDFPALPGAPGGGQAPNNSLMTGGAGAPGMVEQFQRMKLENFDDAQVLDLHSLSVLSLSQCSLSLSLSISLSLSLTHTHTHTHTEQGHRTNCIQSAGQSGNLFYFILLRSANSVATVYMPTYLTQLFVAGQCSRGKQDEIVSQK